MITNQNHNINNIPNHNYGLDAQLFDLMSHKSEPFEPVPDHQRLVNPQAEKILDAPEIKDDYYLNLLDWSSKGVLSIGLG